MTRNAVDARAFILVATDTPTHLQGRNLFKDCHLFNRSMASLTLEPGLDVGFVGELNELW